MVKNAKIKSKLFHPLVLASIFVAAVFYSGIIPVKNTEKYSSLLDFNNLVEFSGQIASNPTKTSKGKYYRVKVKISEVADKNGAKANAAGIVQVLVPSAQIEAHFPGKLFTAIKDNKYVLCEQGSFIHAKGKILDENLFIAENVENTDINQGSLFQKLLKIRAVLRIQFRRLMFSWGAAGGLLLALLSTFWNAFKFICGNRW